MLLDFWCVCGARPWPDLRPRAFHWQRFWVVQARSCWPARSICCAPNKRRLEFQNEAAQTKTKQTFFKLQAQHTANKPGRQVTWPPVAQGHPGAAFPPIIVRRLVFPQSLSSCGFSWEGGGGRFPQVFGFLENFKTSKVLIQSHWRCHGSVPVDWQHEWECLSVFPEWPKVGARFFRWTFSCCCCCFTQKHR